MKCWLVLSLPCYRFIEATPGSVQRKARGVELGAFQTNERLRCLLAVGRLSSFAAQKSMWYLKPRLKGAAVLEEAFSVAVEVACPLVTLPSGASPVRRRPRLAPSRPPRRPRLLIHWGS